MRALLHLDPENMPGHSSPLVECIDEAHAKIVTSAGKRVTYTIQRREMKETHDVEDSRKTCNVYKMVWWQNLKRYDDRDNAENRNQYTGWNQKSNKQMAMTSAKAYINRADFFPSAPALVSICSLTHVIWMHVVVHQLLRITRSPLFELF